MAGDVLSVSVTGLRASQRVLATISNNIANANTDGYSRQQVELSTRSPQYLGNGYVGKGVVVTNVTRVVDSFLDNQLRVNTTSLQFADVTHNFSSQVDNIFANINTGLTPVLQDMFNGMQEVADDPASIPTRQVVLSEARNFVERFHSLSSRLDDINNAVNDQLESVVKDINSFASAIAKVNLDISLSPGINNGILPNDLLDQRDQLVLEMSELVGISVLPQSGGMVNILIGTGQPLVIGPSAQSLVATNNPLDVSKREVAYDIGGNAIIISNNLDSGELGGLLDFRNNVLDTARNGLGRLAAGLSQSLNAQHREGMDLNGVLGGDLFSISGPNIAGAAANTGTVTVAFDPANISNLTTDDYQLDYNGANFILTNLTDNTTQTLGASGAGPFSANGLIITEAVGAVAGDTYFLQPMRSIARDIQLVVTDPRKIAAAAPVVGSASSANGSDAVVSSGEILDVNNANLLNTVNLVFDSATTYQINGVGASIAFTNGANIDINGWRVQITGSPQTGDTFTVQNNAGGVGDNRNMLLVSGLQDIGVFDGGSSTYDNAYAQMVTDVGSRARSAEISLSALTVLKDQAFAAREEVSGVNLDEEAANLLRFQQHYQASAQAIAVASTIFDTLLSAVGR